MCIMTKKILTKRGGGGVSKIIKGIDPIDFQYF